MKTHLAVPPSRSEGLVGRARRASCGWSCPARRPSSAACGCRSSCSSFRRPRAPGRCAVARRRARARRVGRARPLGAGDIVAVLDLEDGAARPTAVSDDAGAGPRAVRRRSGAGDAAEHRAGRSKIRRRDRSGRSGDRRRAGARVRRREAGVKSADRRSGWARKRGDARDRSVDRDRVGGRCACRTSPRP